jgi:ATP-dependent Clp protease ATP-binding subunit ClpC
VFSGFSSSANAALQFARQESERRNQYYVGVEHLFLGLCTSAGGGLRDALRTTGIDPGVLERLGQEMLVEDELPPWGDSLIQTPRLLRVLETAREICGKRKRTLVSPCHLVLAVLSEPRSLPLRVCAEMGLGIHTFRDLIERLPDTDSALEAEAATPDGRTPNLERYGRDLTWLARMHRLDPLIGRESEIARLAFILRKKSQNNALITGEAGTGKTHLVEGLAQEMADPHLEATKGLAGKRIIEIDLNSLVAGTTYRGDFEARLEGILREARDPNIILFIDEFHLILGAGAASGTPGAAQVLKPYLARGEIRCIGSTTTDEYSRFIERDKAFTRRFEIVNLLEPTPEDTIRILKGLCLTYQDHHQVTIEEDALCACVEFAERYLRNRCFPEKAVELLDLACAQAAFAGRRVIDRSAVAQVVFQKTGVRATVDGTAAGSLDGLSVRLDQRVMGQPEAIPPVVNVLRNAQLGLSRPDRPLGVFLLCGPNGVGKTELVLAVAAEVLAGAGKLIRLNMSEYADTSAVTSLIGAPLGYADYDQGGALAEAVRRNPVSVVLLNKIEMAHPEVWRLMARIFDEGRLVDRHQRAVDFTNTLIFMTSSLGANKGARSRPGFVDAETTHGQFRYADLRSAAISAVEKTFDSYFRSRIDEILVFQPLTKPVLRQIIDSEIRAINQMAGLRQNRTVLELGPSAYEGIIDSGYSEHSGAHELKRAIDRSILRPLGVFLNSPSAPANSVILAEIQAGLTKFTWRIRT